MLIAIFAQKYGVRPDGTRFSHCCVPESVGIAAGFLIAALHQAGLATLTHTPNPMGFLNQLCGRPAAEKPVILLVVGYPKAGCQVPVHGGRKKPLEGIAASLQRGAGGYSSTMSYCSGFIVGSALRLMGLPMNSLRPARWVLSSSSSISTTAALATTRNSLGLNCRASRRISRRMS